MANRPGGLIFKTPCRGPQYCPQLDRLVETDDEISLEEIEAAGPTTRADLLSTGQWIEAMPRLPFARTIGGRRHDRL